ncbi:type II toxin-antitoxin system VapC family toxin [Leucobacter insecticola]|uniref:Ribonuclease VapC n=1 Tax=Leucobacter insecticola TaxID=2714934 RepID=A0A6G8FL72_9MICO|nr:type II toxin-antitoxin system VapC family toxin [Leucobacter insecticola]QIM17088.1 type II toxin-antitoxin system VapC family toxin [Leucobacter insecticola]
MIFLDSCILIYAIEDGSERGDRVRAKLSTAEETLLVSPLVLHECLVGPLKDKRIELRERYFEAYRRLRKVPLGVDIYVQAAELRAHHGMKTPDALHLATAQRSRCRELWTNDKRLVAASNGLAVDIIGAA